MHWSRHRTRIGLAAAALLATGATAGSAQQATTLKDAYQDHFMVGVAINRTIATGTAVQADNVNRTLEQVQQDIALVKAQFNQVVDENDLKWALLHPRPGPDGYDFAPADAFVQFGIDNNMYIAGHTLVWHSQTPNWVFQAADAASRPQAAPTPPAANAPAGARPGRGVPGPLATREEMLERMREHIQTVVGRYKGKVKVWDVVNEALADGGAENTEVLRNSLWMRLVGPDFIAKAFQWAHEADPDAILRYNDYGLENPAKRARLKTLIAELRHQGVPVHAIGTQTHINVSTTYETMDETLADLKSIGLPVHITELDVNTAARGQANTSADVAGSGQRTEGGVVSEADRRQAEAYAGLFRAIMKHRDAVKMVTFWGANDAVSWLGRGRPLLFDGNNQPKPAFEAVIRVATGADSN
jgi:endo-1,4-beta-xylanase